MRNPGMRFRPRQGQALLESIMVLPILLIMLLAAADLGKMWVISSKAEIAARHAAFRWQRHDPMVPYGWWGATPPTNTDIASIEEGIYYKGALDDERFASQTRSDDVTFFNYSDASNVLGRDFGPWYYIGRFWDLHMALHSSQEIFGTRTTFTYDISPFVYGRSSHPFSGNIGLDQQAPDGALGFTTFYSASGNFFFLTGSLYDDDPSNPFNTLFDNDLRNELEAAVLLMTSPVAAAISIPAVTAFLFIMLGIPGP